MPPYLQVFLLSMTPIGELRASIPVGILAHQLPWYNVAILSFIGNILPAVFILFLFDYIDHHFRKIAIIDRLYTKYIDRSLKKKKLLTFLGYIGLAIFVSIPSPGTGAYTGSFLAGLLGLNRIMALISVIIGLVLSTVVVTLASLGILHW